MITSPTQSPVAELCPWCNDSPALPVAHRWVLVVDEEWPSSQNQKKGGKNLANSGRGRFAYKKLRTFWEHSIASLARDLAVPAAGRVRRLTLWRRWAKGQRAFDPDNLVAGGKPLLDACVHAGLILGDRADQALIHYQQSKAGDEVASVLIIVEEFEAK